MTSAAVPGVGVVQDLLVHGVDGSRGGYGDNGGIHRPSMFSKTSFTRLRHSDLGNG